MAQLKDLIVNGAAKFNGIIETLQPLKGDVQGNADSASRLLISLADHIEDGNSGKYYYIGSYTALENVSQPFNSKIAVYDRVNNDIRAEIFLRGNYDGVNNVWSEKKLIIHASVSNAKFHLIETSTTELQLWVQISNADYWEPIIYTLYGDALNFSNIMSIVYDELPDGEDTVGEYDIQQHTAYGTCNTSAGTAEKIVIVSNAYWDMTIGSLLTVKFTNTNSANNPTLNINNSGALPIIYNTSAISTTNLVYAGSANRYITYVYTGSAFVFIGWSIDNNTTYGNMTGATELLGGESGLVPSPEAGDQNAFLRGDGTWAAPPPQSKIDILTEDPTDPEEGYCWIRV